jgi:hypothetical protein
MTDTNHTVTTTIALTGTHAGMLDVVDVTSDRDHEPVVMARFTGRGHAIAVHLFGTLDDLVDVTIQLSMGLAKIAGEHLSEQRDHEQGPGPESFDCPEAAPKATP